MSCPSWQRHRTGCRLSPVRTLPLPPDAFECSWRLCSVTWDAVPESRTVVVIKAMAKTRLALQKQSIKILAIEFLWFSQVGAIRVTEEDRREAGAECYPSHGRADIARTLLLDEEVCSTCQLCDQIEDTAVDIQLDNSLAGVPFTASQESPTCQLSISTRRGLYYFATFL